MQRIPTIVLGVDFSPASRRACDTAIRMAKEWGADVLLVHALKPLGAPGLDLMHPQYDAERNESTDVTASEATVAEEWLHRVRREVAAELVSRPGRPADVLIEEAQRVKARAIVVGSHGHTGVSHAVLGSVAEGVLARSWIPVLVVPGRTIGRARGLEARLEEERHAARDERPRWLQ
ncbi:MAG TPA: universal stress protein [Candidatus Thermoplasmatota archaeon]|nr:universal stress protein [Candidatus Thermoplasmatota archaeon]